MKEYVLVDSDANAQRAEVDDKSLVRGGDPVPLTDDQAERLDAAGARVRVVDSTAKDWSKENKDVLESEIASRVEAGREIEVTGTGQDGAVVKADLATALEQDDLAATTE